MDERNPKTLNPTTVGFGLAASVAVIFNTLLAWIKDSNPAVNSAMKAALGHHWITHGVLVVLVFLILGKAFSTMNFAKNFGGTLLAFIIFVSVMLGGLGLVGWFFFI